eukprot:1385814-Amphidinium_carterae.1
MDRSPSAQLHPPGFQLHTKGLLGESRSVVKQEGSCTRPSKFVAGRLSCRQKFLQKACKSLREAGQPSLKP